MRFQSLLLVLLPLLPLVSAGTPFKLLALTKTGNAINQKPVNANGGQFWVGKATKSKCPLPKKECPPGNETVTSIPFASMSMHVKGATQRTYLSSTGALRFTHPDSDTAVPPGSITLMREIHTSGDDVLTWGGDINDSQSGDSTFYACPNPGKTTGPYKIMAAVPGVTIRKQCKAVWLILQYWHEAGFAAYEYV